MKKWFYFGYMCDYGQRIKRIHIKRIAIYRTSKVLQIP